MRQLCYIIFPIFLIVATSDIAWTQCDMLTKNQYPVVACGPSSFLMSVTWNGGQELIGRYQWYILNAGVGEAIPGATSNSYQTDLLEGTRHYYVTFDHEDGGVCPIDTYDFLAVVGTGQPPPTPIHASICGSGSANLGVAFDGQMYDWYEEDTGEKLVSEVGSVLSTGETYVLDGSGRSLYISHISHSANFLVRARGPAGPCGGGQSAVVSVTVHDYTEVSLNLPPEVCNTDASFQLTGASPPGGTWYVNNYPTNVFPLSPNSLGNRTIRYDYTNEFGCLTSAHHTISIGPLMGIGYTNACLSTEALPISAWPPGGTFSSPFVTSDGLFSGRASGVGTHEIDYTYTDQRGCTATATGYVNVLNTSSQFPGRAVAVAENGGCGETKFTLYANFYDSIYEASSYMWFGPDDRPLKDETGAYVTSAIYKTPLITSSTSYFVRAIVDGYCQTSAASVSLPVNGPAPPPVFVTTANCQTGTGEIEITPGGQGSNYLWYDKDGRLINSGIDSVGADVTFISSGPGNSVLKVIGLPQTDYEVYARANTSGPCQATMGSTIIHYREPPQILNTQNKILMCDPGSVTMTADGPGLVRFEWYRYSDPLVVWKTGNQVESEYQDVDLVQYAVAGYDIFNCRVSNSVDVKYSVRPLPPEFEAHSICVFEPVEIDPTVLQPTKIKWYRVNSSDEIYEGLTLRLPPLHNAGEHLFSAKAINLDGCESPTMGQLTITATESCDERLNFIETISYDAGGTEAAKSRQYFDDVGTSMQSQSFSYTTNTALASATVEDKFGRKVVATLTAPTLKSSFQYLNKFISRDGLPYRPLNFDTSDKKYTPDPVDNNVAGSLGWYYSENNTTERYVPTTEYPYLRTEYYEDGTGEVKRSASAGEHHRLGSGHEVLLGIFPVYAELNDYLAKRIIALPGITQDGSLVNEAVQTVVRDENGKYALTISDKSGKPVMSCRAGAANAKVLTVNNSIEASGNRDASNHRSMIYFYIFEDQNVVVGGSGFVIENIITNERKEPGATFAENGTWPKGFYRVLLNESASISLSYTNHFADVSYQYYDDAGQSKVSVSPNGYQAWATNTPYDLIDKTTYTYNHQGWLLTLKEPDAGRTQYVYRKDGQIRFSQNAEQKKHDRFSYTHYDSAGRPVESGEYIGTALSFVAMDSAAFGSSLMKLQLEKAYSQVNWTDEVKKDWMLTHYDRPVLPVPNLPVAFVQEFVGGTVSCTENINAKTWYSYDEQGRVTWMAQKPTALNRTFVTKYTYDFLGNVVTAFNQSYTSAGTVSPFYHHYEYDADKRLSKVYTSVDGSDMKLRATYSYYLHGPLKRVELGDQVQGIDFVYNIHGWLTQINHPDKMQDPGGDSNDAFGMVLDYYESEMAGLFPVAVHPASINDPGRFHHLPVQLVSSTREQAKQNGYAKQNSALTTGN